LQLVADMEADVVVIAEALADQERRNQHGTYDLKLNTKYLGIYTRKDREITCRKRGAGEWALIGGNIGGAYLPPHLDQHKCRKCIENMMTKADTIMGDFNCCGGTKRRVLEEIIETQQWDDIGTTHHTHEQGKHKCRIDRVLTRVGGSTSFIQTRSCGRPWVIKQGWGCLSDHSAIGARVKMKEERKLRLTQTNWKKVMEYVQREKELEEKGLEGSRHQYKYTG